MNGFAVFEIGMWLDACELAGIDPQQWLTDAHRGIEVVIGNLRHNALEEMACRPIKREKSEVQS